MKVIITKKVLKKIVNFPKHVEEDMIETAALLGQVPFTGLDIKKLGSNIYRVRKGKYRMLFRTENDLIVVFEINIRGRISYG